MENLSTPAQPGPGEGVLAGGIAWVERGDEAQRVLAFVLSARSPLVVLYGKQGSGKTSLVRRWIIPALPTGFEGYYADCESALPEEVEGPFGAVALEKAMARRALVFVDSFERLLAVPDGDCEELFERLCRLARPPGAGAILVLILDEARLDRAFALWDRVPELAHGALRIEGISTHRTLAALRSAAESDSLGCDAEVLEELAREIEALDPAGPGVTPELLRFLDEQLRCLRPAAAAPVGPIEYHTLGGLDGLLRGALERRLADLSAALGTERAIGLSLLEEVVRTGRAPGRNELNALAARLEVERQDLERAYSWLLLAGDLLRERRDGAPQVVPAALAAIVAGYAAGREAETREIRWILREGVRLWAQVGALPSRESADRVERHRRDLEVTDDETLLMLRCALRYQETTAGDEELVRARYWLRRLRAAEAKVDLLLASLFDAQAHVRRRAAALLDAFPEPQVREQLQKLALCDPDASVRAAAVASLRGMPDEDFHVLLMQELEDGRSRYRQAAAEALRIFPDDRTVAALAAIVRLDSAPDLRRRVVDVLGALEGSAAAKALVDIALHDKDPEDRAAAAKGLSSWRSEPLVGECLAGLRAARSAGAARWLERLRAAPGLLLRAALATIVTFAGLAFHPLALVLLGRWLLAVLVLASEAVAVGLMNSGRWPGALLFIASLLAGQLLPAFLLLRDRRAGRLERGTFRAALALGLFVAIAAESSFLVHGTAHALTQRWRHAAQLFVLEVVGLLLMALAVRYREAVPAFIVQFYWWLGLLLFVGTFLYDVLRVLDDSVLPRELEKRRWAACCALLRGQAAPVLVLRQLASGDRATVRWARTLLRRCGAEIEPALLIEHLGERLRGQRRFVIASLARRKGERLIQGVCALWLTAAPAARRAIVEVLARRPTEASLAALKALPELNRWQRARAAFGRWQFRLRVWPKGFLYAGLAALPLLIWAGYKGVDTVLRPYKVLVRVVRNEPSVDRIGAAAGSRVAYAELLAKRHPAETLPDLVDVFRTTSDPEVRRGIAHALAIVAGDGSPRRRRRALLELASGLERWPAERPALVAELRTLAAADPQLLQTTGMTATFERMLVGPNPSLRPAALEILESAGEVDALERFVAGRSGQGYGPRLDELAQRRRDDEARLEAVAALGRIGTPESIGALCDLLDSGRLSRELAAQVGEELAQAAQPLEAAYEDGRFADVVAGARSLLEAHRRLRRDVVPRADVLALLGKAECSLALAAPEAPDSAERRRSCQASLAEAAKAGSTDEETKGLLARSYLADAEAENAGGEPAKALRSAEKALAVTPGPLAAAHAARANAYRQLGRLDEALAEFDASIQSDPVAGATYQAAKAYALLEAGQPGPARAAARLAIAQGPDEQWGYQLLLEAWVREGQPVEAERELAELKRRHPDSSEPGLALSFLYHEELSAYDAGAYKKALAELERLSRRPGGASPGLSANLAEAQLTAGRPSLAAATAQRLLAGSPGLDLELPLRFVRYAALVVSGDDREAGTELERLERTYLSLPFGFRDGWVYKGTLRFLDAAPLPANRKAALLRLGGELLGGEPAAAPAAADVFEANRRALASV